MKSLDRWVGMSKKSRDRDKEKHQDKDRSDISEKDIDQSLDETFPASDPPSYMPPKPAEHDEAEEDKDKDKDKE